MHWVAVSYGVLDLRGTPAGERVGEVAVTPIHPGDPVVLTTTAGALWLRLVENPLEASELSTSERELLDEFTAYGIASTDVCHPHRTRRVDPPWLSSALHELVYALVQNVADAAAIKVIFIKGPALHAQALRDREHSGDVDVLVAAGDEEKLAHELEAWGWSGFRQSALSRSPLAHSLPLHEPPWACQVDIHFRFPGIGTDPMLAFHRLMDRADRFAFAGASARVPERCHHAVIEALHILRPPPGRPQPTGSLAAGTEALLRCGSGVIAAASDLGAVPALAVPLRRAFPDDHLPGADGPLPRDWGWMLAPTVAQTFVELVRLVPLRQRPALIFRLVWPPPEYAMAADAQIGGAARGPVRARLARLGRGIRQFRFRGRRQ